MRRRAANAPLLGLLAAVLVPQLGAVPTARASKVAIWRQDSLATFEKGEKQGVVISDLGRVRLARELIPIEKLDATQVWALARADDGTLYAATGNEGKVFRRVGDGSWTVALDVEDSQVFSLAVLPGGRVFAGTGPGGQVVEVTDPKHPASRPDPGALYIWGLASDADGNLYAATGPNGQLWKRSAETGEWSVVLDSRHDHLLCVAVGPDGSIFAGSDGEGLIYRVGPDGTAAVLLDAPQDEVRALLIVPDGSLYAGTAAGAERRASGGGSSRGTTSLNDRDAGRSGSDGGPAGSIGAATAAQARGGNRPDSDQSGGTAAPKPPAPGENAVYHIGPDGAAREVFRSKVLVFALAWQADRLLIGTGPEGTLFEVRDDGRETSPIARLDNGQVLSLLAAPGGELILGAGDPGSVSRLSAGHVASGSLTSNVLDARLPSRYGALAADADRPDGTSLSIEVRTGNVGKPDPTWSAWSPPLDGRLAAIPEVPPGRFAQYRATLKSERSAATPTLRSVALSYQTINLAPEVSRIDIPDLGQGDGASRQTRLALKWDASDPNGDDLTYTLHIRKDGWPSWVRLDAAPLTEKSYNWDTTSVPAGLYRLRVDASDRPSNPPDSALQRELVSEPFLVDHQAPTVTVTPLDRGVRVALKDDLTRLVKSSYSLDGGDWVPIFPDDGLFDTTDETLTIGLPDLAPGVHVLMVRATDAAGNEGAGDLVLEGPEAAD